MRTSRKLTTTLTVLALAATPLLAAAPAQAAQAAPAATISAAPTISVAPTGRMRCHYVINWFGLFNGTANQQWVLRCYYGE